MGSIDEALARFHRLGGEPLVRQMIATFLDNASERIEAARRALDAGDHEQLAFAAHSLKSSAGNLGASELMTLAAELETRANAGNARDLGPLVERLTAAFSSVREQLAGSEACLEDDARKRIAVVEDNPDNRLLVHAILEERYEILEYETGAEALPEIVKERSDLVLLDISLPGMDGTEVLKQIRLHDDFLHLPVIALTAHAMAGDREKYLTAGFDDYVAKPIVDENVLLETIARHLQP